MAYELTQSCIDIDAGACGLSSTEKLILITLCRFADDNGENCFPSRETIVQSTGLSLRTVKDRIPCLEEKGWFTTKQEVGQGRYFFLNVEKILGAEKITRVNSAPGTKTTRVNFAPPPGSILHPHPGQFCPPKRTYKRTDKRTRRKQSRRHRRKNEREFCEPGFRSDG